MSRLIFRVLVVFTLIGMFYARMSGGHMPAAMVPVFYYWFVISVGVFLAFGISAAVKAWRDPVNRRAYYFDIVLAVIWIPYWFTNLH